MDSKLTGEFECLIEEEKASENLSGQKYFSFSFF